MLLFSQTVPGNGCRIWWFVCVCCRLWSQWSPQYSVRSVVQWSFSLSCLACDMFIVAQKTDIRWSRSFRLIFTWLCPSRLTPLNLKEHYISLSLRKDKMMFVFLDVSFSEASVLMKNSLHIELLILTWKENAQYIISSGMYWFLLPNELQLEIVGATSVLHRCGGRGLIKASLLDLFLFF